MSYDPDDYSSNPSSNTPFREVLAARMSRRDVLRGGVVAAATGFFSAPTGSFGRAALAAPDGSQGKPGALLGFEPIPTSTADAITVPDGYEARVLVPWGTPIQSTGPAWRKDASNTAAEQAQQVGMHHDGMHYFPLRQGSEGNRRGLLVLNHEYVDRTILYSDGDAVVTREKVDKALAAHGVSVVEIALVDGTWQLVGSPSTVGSPARPR